jgi:hypothetical protein
MRQAQVLDPWRLQTYALQWRSLARQWKRLASSRQAAERAAKLRRAAGGTLHAASGIDVFLGKEERLGERRPTDRALSSYIGPFLTVRARRV